MIILVIPFACRYDDGPLISFRSVKNRLEGRWQVIGFTSDGNDSLQYYNDSCGCKMTINFLSDENDMYFDECPLALGGVCNSALNKKNNLLIIIEYFHIL